jgi:hypothetical protein
MIAKVLQRRLQPVAQRQRAWRLWRELTAAWLVVAAVAVGLVVLKRFTGWCPAWVPWLLGLGAAGVGVRIWWRTGHWQPDYRQLARRIEQHEPELHALLLTAVQQQPDPATGQYHYLQERVIQQAIEQSFKQRWIEAISPAQLRWMRLGHWAALAGLVALLSWLPSVSPKPAKLASGDPVCVEVSPGDAQVERGSGLVVWARFSGSLPTEVHLVIGTDTNHAVRVPLAKTLNDPIFGGSIPAVTSNFTYHVDFGAGRTRDFQVTVFEHPRLERADAHLHFPAYTGLGEKHVPDTRRISAVEGTRVDFTFQLNKPVKAATWTAKDGTRLPLTVESNRPVAHLRAYLLETNRSFDLHLVDEAGRTNKVPAQFVLEALPNRRPELKIVAPRGDQRVSPLEEVQFQAEVVDDFGLRGWGLTWRLGGGASNEIVLGQSAPAGEKRVLKHLLALEELSVQPGQLITWFVWADDIGPDGQKRRTSSDLYFLEVRPFEEGFREVQAPDSQAERQGAQAQGEAQRLAEQQKQIINATWKLQRDQAGQPPTDSYRKDSAVIKQAQQDLLDKVKAGRERIEDARSQKLLAAVQQEMTAAVQHLDQASSDPAALAPAQAREQAAYQALLQLADREVLVARSRNRPSQGMGARRQAQLDQLELKTPEDRYETQRQAAPPTTPEQQEQLALLNRLKELAQRQQDLNEKIKELQAALQEARTEAEREEIRRQLKRLREEQQDLLADLDELRARMDRSQNQTLAAEARRQLDRVRADVQRAAEALQREESAQALASGTRAQRDLQQLRDEFRRRSASQFREDMRQMRATARELAQKQEQIGQQLDQLNQLPNRKTLAESDQTGALAGQLQQQKTGLTNLLNHMRRVTDQAESSEPLLARQLYDTLRKATQAGTDNALTLSQELLRRNLVHEASQFEQRARADIDELRRGVERAAESVLGDELEALRRAKRELDDLARQLEEEMAQAESAAAAGLQPASTNLLAMARSRSGAPGRSAQQPEDQTQARPGTPGQQPRSEPRQTGSAASQDQARPAGSARPERAEAQQAGGPQPDNRPAQQPQPSPGQQAQAGQQARPDQPGQPQANPAQPRQGLAEAPAQNAQGQAAQGQAQAQPSHQQQTQTPEGRGQGRMRTGDRAPRDQQPAQARAATPAQANNPQGAPSALDEARQPADRMSDQRSQWANAERGAGGRQPRGTSTFFDLAQSAEGLDGTGPARPLTGPDYETWSERLGNVEEMVDDPNLRTDLARIRERARAVRVEFKRHGKAPQWDLVRTQIAAPLTELRLRLSEEVARRESKDALVPIDRDPVPSRYSDLVRRYYEKLGKGQ